MSSFLARLVCALVVVASGFSTAIWAADSSVSAIDKQIIRQLFSVHASESGILLRAGSPMPTPGSDDPVEQYFARSWQLLEVHDHLMREDEDYLRRFKELERYVILEVLPKKPTAPQARRLIFEYMEKHGLVVSIVQKAGPTTLAIPEQLRNLDEKIPFIRTVGYSASATGIPKALVPFHCCAMRLVVTELGEEYSALTNAHRYLLANDKQYRSDYIEITAPLEDRLRRLDPMEIEAVRACEQDITREWREAFQLPVDGRVSLLTRLENAARNRSIQNPD